MFLQLVEILLTLSDCHFEWERKHILIRVLQAGVFFRLWRWQKKRSANCSVWSHVWGLYFDAMAWKHACSLLCSLCLYLYHIHSHKKRRKKNFWGVSISQCSDHQKTCSYFLSTSNISRWHTVLIAEKLKKLIHHVFIHVVNEYMDMLLNWD